MTNAVRDLTVDELELFGLGSGDESTGISALTLWEDANSNGRIDGGDPQLQRLLSPFAMDNGAARFRGLGRVIPQGTTRNWLVTCDLAAVSSASQTYRVRIDGGNGLLAPEVHGKLRLSTRTWESGVSQCRATC